MVGQEKTNLEKITESIGVYNSCGKIVKICTVPIDGDYDQDNENEDDDYFDDDLDDDYFDDDLDDDYEDLDDDEDAIFNT